MIYHGSYEAGAGRVDALPGGKAWREEIERVPGGASGTSPSTRTTWCARPSATGATSRRPSPRPPSRAPARSSAPASRQLEKAGMTELVYAPHGPDLARELRAMAEAAGIG